LRDYLERLEKGTPVAVEASGGWYWFMDELEKAGLDARLVNPLEAKHRMSGKNKTDKLDARGLAILLRNGTLPEVWIPPADLRDLRGLMRTRLATRSHTTVWKNRIHAALRRYGVMAGEKPMDLFAKKSRLALSVAIGRLPEETRRATLHEWEMLDLTERHIGELEVRIREKIGRLGWVRLLKSIPGVGEILGATIHLEIGDVGRFPSAERLAKLRRSGADGARQRRQELARPDLATGQSLSALGLRGSRRRDSDASRQVRRPACDRTLRQAQETQVPRQGSRGRGQTSGRSQLVDSDQTSTLSAAACANGGDVCVQKRVSAFGFLAFKAVRVIAKPGAEMLMPDLRADR
jgi:transposase